MNLIADLHIHSHYSRATSKDLTFAHLARWAQLKGIQVVGTGDIAHPGWLQEMHQQLEPATPGLYRLKPEYAQAVAATVPAACRGPVYFLLAGEISNIYKKYDRVRKIHHVIFAPSLEIVGQIQQRLEKIGNIRADGRPILGLDSRHLLEIILDIDPDCHLIPAHIWTPWFGLLGSQSGFDSVTECFGDLTPHIFALETGLSSDPPMNWRVSALDGYTLVSNSDAHSPQKLGREVTLLDTEPSYEAIFAALRSGDTATFRGTIEFFPEEGKYHIDGHRQCQVAWEPATTRAHHGRCSVCGKPVTVGVMHRVELLADRPTGTRPDRTPPYTSLIPLPEILSERHGVGVGSKRVQAEYFKLLDRLGPELAILRHIPLEEIMTVGGEKLAEGIGRMRRGEVTAVPGYDGEYGLIHLFDHRPSQTMPQQIGFLAPTPAAPPRLQESPDQLSLFTAPPAPVTPPPPTAVPPTPKAETATAVHPLLSPLNLAQRDAAQHITTPLIITAGPGTGKTRTLTTRIAYLLQIHGVSPTAVLSITFTNRAALEMSDRLHTLLGPTLADQLSIHTFHAFGLRLLREFGTALNLPPDFAIADEEARRSLLRQALPDLPDADLHRHLEQISLAKNQLWSETAPSEATEAQFTAVYHAYEAARQASQCLDYDDLILQAIRLLADCPEVRQLVHGRYHWLSVDEYQDINAAQYRLLRLLTAGGANLCVIGDPDQAIYGFRGADRGYFLRFHQDYPHARQLSLAQNYRSTQLILAAAIQVMAQSHDQRVRPIWSEFVDTVKVDVYPAATDRAEAEYVVHQIEQMVGGTSYFSLDSRRVVGDTPARPFADFAILYRLKAQAALLLEALERAGMPYQAVGQLSFYQQAAVRRALAWLWLCIQPRSWVHLETAVAGKRPFSPAALARLQSYLTAPAVSLATALTQAAMAGAFGAAQQDRLRALVGFWQQATQTSTPPLVTDLIDGLRPYLAPLSPADMWPALTLRAAPYGRDLAAFLHATTLHQEADIYDPRADRITLLTLHAAKGLEFPVVFIVGCEEGVLPYLPVGKPGDLEEERRLFYVGLTRARHKLILTHANRRFLWGQHQENPPSRFVHDIATALKAMQEPDFTPRPAVKPPETVQLRLFD